MANICNNEFCAISDNPENIKTIEDFFSKMPYADVDTFDNVMSVYFESKWTFPEELMQELYDKIPDKEDIFHPAVVSQNRASGYHKSVCFDGKAIYRESEGGLTDNLSVPGRIP